MGIGHFGDVFFIVGVSVMAVLCMLVVFPRLAAVLQASEMDLAAIFGGGADGCSQNCVAPKPLLRASTSQLQATLQELPDLELPTSQLQATMQELPEVAIRCHKRLGHAVGKGLALTDVAMFSATQLAAIPAWGRTSGGIARPPAMRPAWSRTNGGTALSGATTAQKISDHCPTSGPFS